MKITSIKQQLKSSDRYSVFVDDAYSFSLSTAALLESGISGGTEVTAAQLSQYKKLSNEDKIYGLALRYIAMRPRSTWEMQFYLERKNTDPHLIEIIVNKLTKVDLLNDVTYAETYVRNRRLLKPSSRRKLKAELQQKRVASSIIDAAIGSEATDEGNALAEIIKNKRRQTKYQDDTKLMQYLACQGFGYGDIKAALAAAQEED